MTGRHNVKQGDIWWVDFNPGVGVEIRGVRPALIIQSDRQTRISNLVTVLPLTSNMKNRIEGDIVIHKSHGNRLYSDSVIKVRAIMSFDRGRFRKKIGVVDDTVVGRVKEYLKGHFGINAPSPPISIPSR